MPTNFINVNSNWPSGVDLDDIYVRADIFQEGNLYLVGNNDQGQLGDNTVYTSKSSPVQTIAGGTDWKQIFVGKLHNAAIKTNGELWTWGYNNYGQLGDNTFNHRSSPVQTMAGGTNWKQVSLGDYFSVAIKTDGTLWGWGLNTSSQLGDGTSATYRSSPVQTVCSGANWKQVDAGNNFTTAIKTDGTLWTWGDNTYGQLGNGADITPRSSPIQTITGGTNWKQVSAGGAHIAAIKTDGTLWGWGRNDYGQLGNGADITPRSSPVQTIAGGTNWKQVSTGNYHVAAIKTNGELWTWGRNDYGQLGDNTITPRSSPVQTIASGTNWKQLSAGDYHVVAIKTDGNIWTWGYNNDGQLCNGADVTHRSSPIQTIAGGTNWKQVEAGGSNSAFIRISD